jgi:hypothetical protein
MRIFLCARMDRRGFLAGVAATVGLAAVGCGGNGDEPVQLTGEPAKGGNRERMATKTTKFSEALKSNPKKK